MQVYLWYQPCYPIMVTWMAQTSHYARDVRRSHWHIRQGMSGSAFPRRAMHASLRITMSSLSQALRLGYLPSPHSTFQEHAAHITRWPAMLSSEGSSSTCILD